MKTDLLENIAEALGIYISDLRHEDIQKQTLSYIIGCNGYEAVEWNKLIHYMFGIKCDFSSESEAKDFYIRMIAAPVYRKI